MAGRIVGDIDRQGHARHRYVIGQPVVDSREVGQLVVGNAGTQPGDDPRSHRLLGILLTRVCAKRRCPTGGGGAQDESSRRSRYVSWFRRPAPANTGHQPRRRRRASGDQLKPRAQGRWYSASVAEVCRRAGRQWDVGEAGSATHAPQSAGHRALASETKQGTAPSGRGIGLMLLESVRGLAVVLPPGRTAAPSHVDIGCSGRLGWEPWRSACGTLLQIMTRHPPGGTTTP